MSDKEAGQVLTSENAATFYAERLGLADSATETAADTPVENSEPDEVKEQSEPTEADTAKPQEERKQNPKLEKRFSEITKQREEARQEAQREREARQALETRLQALERQSAPQQNQAQNVEQEPQPHQFSDAFEYAKALTDYRVEHRLAQEKANQAEAAAQAERQQVISQWTKKVDAAKAELPDFDEMVQSAGDVVIPDHVRDAMMESDVGPKLLYYFAENPDVARSIAAMQPIKALREIGKLEAKLETPKQVEKPPVARSKAPEPIQPIRASGKADIPIGANGEFHGSYQAWKAARKAGRIK
jgi:hypothetical protein